MSKQNASAENPSNRSYTEAIDDVFVCFEGKGDNTIRPSRLKRRLENDTRGTEPKPPADPDAPKPQGD